MKIIEQSAEFIHEPDPMKLIEAAGRTCYKSEDKIGCGKKNGIFYCPMRREEILERPLHGCDHVTCSQHSSPKFVKMITKAGHYSVLEHASICFEIDSSAWEFIENSFYNKYLHWGVTDTRRLVSGNFGAWKKFFQNKIPC